MPRTKHLPRRHKYIPPLQRTPRVAIYVRVSTHYQIDRDSLPFQRQELENYCRYALNIESFMIYEDAGYSAKNTDRPDYQKMMARIREGEFTHLLVWKLDRISRNLRDFTELWDELKEYGVSFISKMEQFDTSTAMGEAMLRIILIFAELERKLTAERVYGIMLSRAEKGLWNGAPVPLGYDYDTENKTAVVNQEEADLVQQIYDRYENLQSATDVAKWLYESGAITKRGGKWGSKGVIDILRNPIYIGIYRWNYRESARGDLKPKDDVIMLKDALPAIISRDQWERVQKLLNDNYKGSRSQQRHSIHTHLLSRLIKCAYCGKHYVCALATRPHKKGYLPTLYRCGEYMRNRQCHNKPISGLIIEPFVLEYLCAYVKASTQKSGSGDLESRLLQIFCRPEIEYISVPDHDRGTDAALLGMGELAASSDAPESDQLEALRGQKKKIERAIARLDDAYYFADGLNTLSKSEYLVKRSDFQQNLSQVDSEISALAASGGSASDMALDINFYSRFLLLHNLYTASSIRDLLPDLDKQVVQEFLQQVFQYVEVADGRVTKICFNAPAPNIHQFIYKDSLENQSQ